jgi:oligopeptide/dipeptide ABC transporter ATP-binding protein
MDGPPRPPPAAAAAEPLLAVEGLTVSFPSPAAGRWVPVVRGASFDVARGEMVGLVGESGSGKSMTALALMRLVPPPGRIAGGRVRLGGEELLALSPGAMRRLRGSRLAMVFQEPMSALNPVYTVGFQLVEAVRAHRRTTAAEARREAVRLLDLVALADARRRLDDYPHQLSGGQRQRVMIAIALAARPDLLLADEPTTALDVTIQAQILELLGRLRRDLGLTVLLITHDLALVAETCDRGLVFYAGRVVEEAAVGALFARPAHPYTRALLAALPRLGAPAARGRLPTVPGRVPDPAALPSGCAFHPRCADAMAVCRRHDPQAFAVGAAGDGGGQRARCFLYGEPAAPGRAAGGEAAR